MKFAIEECKFQYGSPWYYVYYRRWWWFSWWPLGYCHYHSIEEAEEAIRRYKLFGNPNVVKKVT